MMGTMRSPVGSRRTSVQARQLFGGGNQMSSSPTNMTESAVQRMIVAALVALLLMVAIMNHYLPETTSHIFLSTTLTARRVTSHTLSVLKPLHVLRNKATGTGERGSSGVMNALQAMPSRRLAVLLPYAARGTASIASYLPLFCLGAAGSSSVADFYILHNGVLNVWPLLHPSTKICPDNVFFVDLQDHTTLAQRLLRVLEPNTENDDPSRNSRDIRDEAAGTAAEPIDSDFEEELLSLISSFIKVNPYGLVEFKPALGHIFSDLITATADKAADVGDSGDVRPHYSHWGYSDLDILFGDLPRWITADEWEDYDVVTYSYGDQDRLYLRGQFTMHKNTPAMRQLWRDCSYLSKADERFRAIWNREAGYRTESAEGCYSTVVLNHRENFKVKYTVKAWNDIEPTDTAYSHGIYWSRNPLSGQSVIFKQYATPSQAAKSIGHVPPQWFVHDTAYQDLNQPLQKTVGGPMSVPLEFDENTNCMYWVLKQYQKKLCLSTAISANETVYWIDGQLYKQAHENVKLLVGSLSEEPVISTAPFFHFQEWKRRYRYSQLATMHLRSPIHDFILTPVGAIPLVAVANAASDVAFRASSPLGMVNMAAWKPIEHDDDEFMSQLPPHLYCLLAEADPDTHRAACVGAISWRNPNSTEILLSGAAWNLVQIEQDVTLVLTLQIAALQAQAKSSVQALAEHMITTMQRWQGQPCVGVIFMAGASMEMGDFLLELFQGVAETLPNCLVGAIYEQGEVSISRKALINMASDAVPTRWYVSGLELERGLTLSADAVYFSHRAVAAHNGPLQGTGHVFVMPQFALSNNNNSSSVDVPLSDLVKCHRDGFVQHPGDLDSACEKERAPQERRIQTWVKEYNLLWWDVTAGTLLRNNLSAGSIGTNGHLDKATVHAQALSLYQIETSLVELLNPDNHHTLMMGDESPILLTDNRGPHRGIRTDEIARHVDELGGVRCFHDLRLAQLIALGYRLHTLPGAFALSTEATRQTTITDASAMKISRCQNGCFLSLHDPDTVHRLVQEETQRVAMTATVWAEISGMKQI